jgi:phosphoglycolate phosphatase-like HAD superfamily hydrolase
MHIVSGSDQEELREVCRYHGIAPFFQDIEGSPTPKKQLVASLLTRYGYTPDRCVLVGDSVNDYEAASVNGLRFFPYNNPDLQHCNTCT